MYYFSGPQTIADLQQKLLQLTSQPSERVLTGTPPSHPATPQVQHTYDSYMQTLHQKLTSISMPSGHSLVSRLKTGFMLCLLWLLDKSSKTVYSLVKLEKYYSFLNNIIIRTAAFPLKMCKYYNFDAILFHTWSWCHHHALCLLPHVCIVNSYIKDIFCSAINETFATIYNSL